MKRAVVAILAILYLTASSGVAISAHWCMGRVAGTSITLLGDDDHHACKRCGMEKKGKGGCCHDEHKIVKAAEDQTLTAKTILQLSSPIALPVKAFTLSAPPQQAGKDLVVVAPAHGPPLAQSLPIYLQVRSIRI